MSTPDTRAGSTSSGGKVPVGALRATAITYSRVRDLAGGMVTAGAPGPLAECTLGLLKNQKIGTE